MIGDLFSKIFLLLILLTVSAFFSCAEASLFSLRRTSAPSEKNKFIYLLLSDPQRLLLTIFAGNDFANSTLSAIFAGIFMQLNFPQAEIISGALSFLLILILAEIFPRRAGFLNAEILAPFFAPILYILSFLLYPFYKFTNVVVSLLYRYLPAEKIHEALAEEDIELLLKSPEVSEELSREELELLGKVFKLDRMRCSEIMLKREEIPMIRLDTPVEEIKKIISSSPYRYFIIYDEESNIEGVVDRNELIPGLLSENFSLSDYVKFPVYVPEAKRVLHIINDFKGNPSSVFLVVNEFGVVTGIITMNEFIKKFLEKHYFSRQDG